MPFSSAKQLTAWITTGLGLLTLIASGVVGLWVISIWNLMNEPCPPDEDLCEMSPGAPIALFGGSVVAVALLVTGFVLVVVGQALFRSNRRAPSVVPGYQRWQP